MLNPIEESVIKISKYRPPGKAAVSLSFTILA